MSSSRLLIIDLQSGFINDWTAQVPRSIQPLQDSFEHVIATRFFNPRKSLFRKLIGENGFALGAVDTQMAITLREDAEIIDKCTYSGIDEDLITRFRREDVNRIHLCGISTEASVLKSALDLFEAGIEPVILAHACGSAKGPQFHEMGLALLRRLIGDRQVIGC